MSFEQRVVTCMQDLQAFATHDNPAVCVHWSIERPVEEVQVNEMTEDERQSGWAYYRHTGAVSVHFSYEKRP